VLFRLACGKLRGAPEGWSGAMLNSKDALAGFLFVVIGLLAVFFARTYAFGTARAMGPGYFPIVLGCLIAGLGAVLLAKALIAPSEADGVTRMSPRAILLILASIVAFAVLIRPAGLIVAVSAAVIVGRLAGTKVRLVETIAMTVILVAVCGVLFVYALNMPLHLLPR
jgi:putative tricarboxylic transport membrane protein